MISVTDLAVYVEAVSNLAMSVESDIIDNEGVIRENTVLALNNFAKAMAKVSAVVDHLEQQNKKLN